MCNVLCDDFATLTILIYYKFDIFEILSYTERSSLKLMDLSKPSLLP